MTTQVAEPLVLSADDQRIAAAQTFVQAWLDSIDGNKATFCWWDAEALMAAALSDAAS